MMPQPFKLEVIRQTGKQYQAVRAQLHRKDVGQVIIATDAGREGELVARLILEKAGNDKPVKRLWISSVTDKAICQGFAALRKSVRRGHVPGGGRLAGGHQRHPGSDLQIQRPALLRPGSDTDTGDDRGA